LPLDDTLKLLKKLRLGEVKQEDYSSEDDPGLTLVSVDDAGLNLWFKDRVLTEVQFSQVWEDEE